MLSEDLNRIKRLKAELDAIRPIPEETMAKVMQKFRLDWNYHSNSMEGNSLTFGETKTFLLHGNTASGKPLKDHLEIKGHNEAILDLEDMIKGEVQLTEHKIRSFHQLILGEPYATKALTKDGMETTKQIVPGKYKSQPNHVLTSTGETFYFTEPNLVPLEMEQLLKWFEENQTKNELPTLILAATFHYKFIRIHPFDDGNGRMARILMNLILMMNGYPPVVIKTEEKENYFRALRQADGGELNPFIEYIGQQLIHSLELTLKGANGESIDEDDDIDKRLKLLLGQIEENKKNVVRVKRDPSHVFETVAQSIVPLIEEVISNLPKMNSFFLNISNEITIPLEPSARKTFKNLSQLKESYQTYARNLDDSFPKSITVSISLNGYKHSAEKADFNIQTNLYILFNEYTYTVNSSYPQIIKITLPYSEQISIEQIKTFSKNLLGQWVTMLEAISKS
ncbi:Fic family protein [Leptospira bandrabouensis]|uniref:Fic family protein n=1 Tax=Leptospira bandrabouensis TaxID=2484903 RepID=UPI00223D0C96|nr:Fic family protein [Leptospira bandrabouensis]MCW7457361.1 Fic family protein [Leptospira bandrabouensis]MCW7476363.1 Fic family protein [Leptospira bandrabouensis]MCW7484046.1 Fic family protein [Leptospira bandrabouensis]